MKNYQHEELFNLLNNMVSAPGSHRELAQTKTLRNHKAWYTSFAEKIQDIKDLNCATKEVDGVKILMRETLKRTVKTAAGQETTDEYKVNIFTPEGEKNCKEQTKAFLYAEASEKVEIYSTSDDKDLSEYMKEVLSEYGFLLSAEMQASKIKSIKKIA